MKSRWSEPEASSCAGMFGSAWGEDLALRVYSSRLLGADPSLVLPGGGNTSLKSAISDVTGERRPALCVKGSGIDLGTIDPSGFCILDLERLRRLGALAAIEDGVMYAEFDSCALLRPAPSPSLETLVHALLEPRYIDHTHPDAILALGNQEGGEARLREALGDRVAILAYVHPGLPLAVASARAFASAAGADGMVWRHHGLVSWGETARESYERTIALVDRAESYLARKTVWFGAAGQPASGTGVAAAATDSPRASDAREGVHDATGGIAQPDVALPGRKGEVARRLERVAPVLRGALAGATGDPDRPWRRVVLSPLTDEVTRALLEAPGARETLGTPPLTADHLIHTRAFPLFVDAPAWDDEDRLADQVRGSVERYAGEYRAYLERHAGSHFPGASPADTLPRVVLLPGLGLIAAGHGLAASRLAREIAGRTVRVKAAIGAMGVYRGLGEADLFAMEFRAPQQAKLERRRGGALAGCVALVTGAAGAIGAGLCGALLEEGALVAAADLPGERLDRLAGELSAAHEGRARAVPFDVADPAAVRAAFGEVVREWGGLDMLVINAGVAHVSPIAAMDLEEFRRLERVNVEGTLLTLREAAGLFARQGTGGDVVLVSSKNVFAPGAGFGAYSATKAAAHQLARIASLEMAPLGVRVNMVAPDAVFGEGERRSGLWREVGPERMRARGLDERGLEEYYRQRNLLKARITADHVAKAVLFFLTRQAPITGATLPVDGGLPEATPR